jgi:hypothetical protein
MTSSIGAGGIEATPPMPAEQENLTQERIEQMTKSQEDGSPLDVGFEKQNSEDIKESPEKQAEINEVAESARTLEAATHDPEAKIESEGDYKQSENLQAVFTQAVDAVPDTREADPMNEVRDPGSDAKIKPSEDGSGDPGSQSGKTLLEKDPNSMSVAAKEQAALAALKGADQELSENSTAAKAEGTTPGQLDGNRESRGEDGFVVRDQDGSDGSPQIDYGGLETTVDIREPTDISDAYGPDSMKGANQGEGVGYQGGELTDGLEMPGGDMPGGLDGDLPGGIDGMPGGRDGYIPFGMGGDSFSNEDPGWAPGGESDNTDFVSGSDLAGIAASGRTGLAEGDDKPADGTGSDSSSGSSSGSSPDSSSGTSPDSSSGTSSSVTAGQRVYRRNIVSRTAGYVWNAISSGSGSDNPAGGGFGAPRGTPDPNSGSEGGGTISTEELNEIMDGIHQSLGQPGGDEMSMGETGPPPDLSGELGSALDPLINWGDEGEEGDEEFMGSQPDVDITPVDPPEIAGGGEDIEDGDGISEGFEDIDP